MKKKSIFAITVILAIALLVSITVFGANELGFIGNNAQAASIVQNAKTLSNNSESDEYINLVATSQNADVDNNVQEIVTQLEPSSYPTFVVQKGVPVKWTMVADSKNLNSCNNEIIIPSLNISKPLKVGDNVIEFTPTETGVIPYSCWMGMINSAIVVVDDINNYDKAEVETQLAEIPQSGGCNMSGGLSGRNGGGCCGGKR